jgi:chitinase
MLFVLRVLWGKFLNLDVLSMLTVFLQTSSVFCQAKDAAGQVTTPCQQGYGNCAIVSPPRCDISRATASNGRKVAYYQAANVRYRGCNRIQASQINTDGLTHLIFTFASIDPTTFNVVQSDRGDSVLYQQFVALKTSQLQTWVSIGGGDFSDPGTPTFHTWSDMVGSAANRAAFISSLGIFLDSWGFQGVDLDWEYPRMAAKGGRPGDTANLCSLLSEMRAAFGNKYGISIVL